MKVNNETKIGILVVVVLLGLGILTFQVGDFDLGDKGYPVYAVFKNIDGVEENAPVRLNGMEIGKVKSMRIIYEPATKMELTLWIKEGYRIREETKVYVRTMGMFGEKYIGLSTTVDDAPFLKPGARVAGEEPADFEKLLVKGEAIANNLKEITDNLNERLKINAESIDDIILNIRKASKDIASISVNVNERLTLNQGKIDSIMGNLDSATQNLEEMSADIKENPWKLLYKPRKK